MPSKWRLYSFYLHVEYVWDLHAFTSPTSLSGSRFFAVTTACKLRYLLPNASNAGHNYGNCNFFDRYYFGYYACFGYFEFFRHDCFSIS